jgi:hypothetical protein
MICNEAFKAYGIGWWSGRMGLAAELRQGSLN